MRKLFQLVGEISIKGMTALNKQFSETDQKARLLQKRIVQLGRNFEKVGQGLTKSLTVPLAAVGAASIKFGADFQKAMAGSMAIMGDLSDAMKKDMEVAARSVAKTTRFSAKEAAEAYYFLASAGLSAAQSIGALPRVAAFAQAGNFDLALATELLADAQSALGMRVKDATQNMLQMTRVSDVLVKANTLANASVLQFSEALTNKAGAALRILNKDIEEGVAVLAVYADQGVKGAGAGEQLTIVMRDMQRASIDQRPAWQAAGIAVFDANGKMRNMADIVEQLSARLIGMSDEQRRVELGVLGLTDRSISATMALLGTSNAIREYEEKLRGAGGTTDAVAEKQLKNLWDQLGLVKNRLIDLGLTIYGTLEPIIKSKLLPVFNRVIKELEDIVNAFASLPTPLKETIFLMVGLAATVGPVFLILGKTIIATKGLTSAILLMNASLAANPLGLVAVLVAALALEIKLLVSEYKRYQDIVKNGPSAEENKEFHEQRIKTLQEENEKIKEAIKFQAEMGSGLIRWQTEQGLVSKSIAGANGHLMANNILIKRYKEALGEIVEPTKEAAATTDTLAISLAAAAKPLVAAESTAEKANDVKEEEIALSKELIQQRLSETKDLLIQSKLKIDLLAIEEKEKIAATVGGEDAVQKVIELYARKRFQIEKETEYGIQELKDQGLEEDKKREQDRTDSIIEQRKRLKAFFEDDREQEKEENLQLFNTIAGATQEFNNYVGQISDNYYQKQFNLLETKQQKEIDAVNKSTANEELKGKQIDAINKKYAKESLKLRRDQAKKDKVFAIFSAIINTAMGIAQAIGTILPKTLAFVYAGIIGALGAVQIAAIASQPLPMAKGGLVRSGKGGIQAEIGEGAEDEIVLPMKTGVQALADALMDKLSRIEIPHLAAPQMALAGGGGGGGGGYRGGDINLHIGTLVADDSGLKELERRLYGFRVSDEQRKGRTYNGYR